MAMTPEQSQERYVEVEFAVTSQGTVKDARVVDENASSRQETDALEAVTAARYRPKFVDGEPVETPAMTYRTVFKTRKRSEDKEEVAAPESDAAEKS
jgi:TonB family protein